VSNQKQGIAREAVRAAERIAGVEAATVEAAQCGTCGRALGLNPRDGIWTASGPAPLLLADLPLELRDYAPSCGLRG
jgi:hypothetical protein